MANGFVINIKEKTGVIEIMSYPRWSEKTIEKRYKEGRGSGEGINYKPWLDVDDVPSEGLSNRPKGWKTQRDHDLLSNLELYAFFIFEWSDSIIDIREQYPLDRTVTLAISEKSGIKHPVYKGKNVKKDDETGEEIPEVMTTDFLLTVKTEGGIKEVARSIKPSSDLENLRTIEKLEIERLYWKAKNIDWGIITDKDFDSNFTKNMDWIHHCRELPLAHSQTEINKLVDELKLMLFSSDTTFLDILNQFDYDLNLPKGSALAIFRHAIATKKIKVDMLESIETTREVKELIILDEINYEEEVAL